VVGGRIRAQYHNYWNRRVCELLARRAVCVEGREGVEICFERS